MPPSLFSPLRLGPYQLGHRVVMAPLTRMRAGQPGNVPTGLNATYYGQRASRGGLIIAEATQISPTGQGYPATPGIHSEEQIEGWRGVTDAVHARLGYIFLQLWHVGRISHPSLQPDGRKPVAPSAIRPAGEALTVDWQRVPFEIPRALETQEIPGIIADYRRAAVNALAAGFDGVEIHGANGYLLEQFLQSRSNQRNDRYGGSIENRARLLLEVTEAVAEVWGADRVGVRLSPFGNANDSGEADPMPLYEHVIRALAPMGLAYLHLIEPRASSAGKADTERAQQPSASELFRPLWPGVLIGAGGYERQDAIDTVAQGTADAIAFGRAFIANPDLPLRLQRNADLNSYDRATFYGGSARGYTDYPALDAAMAAD
jgi:N-ethylmaleimide reductase